MALRAEDRPAVERLLAVAPAWSGVRSAAEVIGLEERTLLHCGPPAEPHNALVIPTLNSAAVACVFEGWADDLAQATAMIEAGEIAFAPAQDRGVATPMAAVVSPSMQMLELVDSNDPQRRACAPLNGGGTGGGPAPRYGRKTQAALDLLKFLNHEVAPAIAPACAEPLDWLAIIDEALVKGDDVHLRHVEAHALLLGVLRKRLGAAFAGSASEAFIAEWPIFHLNFWMAAVRCILAGAAGCAGSGIITAMGGNGEHFGLQVSGLPGRWFSVAATPPRGHLREPHTPESCVGAYGDSALVEGFGLGAMAHSYCPDMQAFHKDFVDADMLSLPGKLLVSGHPRLHRSKARVGLSAHAVLETGVSPVVELGIVDKSGVDGGLGAGLYRPPLAPFAQACEALETSR